MPLNLTENPNIVDWVLKSLHGLLLIICTLIAWQGHAVLSTIQKQAETINSHSIDIATLKQSDTHSQYRLQNIEQKLDRLLEQTKK